MAPDELTEFFVSPAARPLRRRPSSGSASAPATSSSGVTRRRPAQGLGANRTHSTMIFSRLRQTLPTEAASRGGRL